jgi:hypothetical protein
MSIVARRVNDTGHNERRRTDMRLVTILSVAGSFALFLGSAVPRAFALPANEVETIFYASADLQEEVGYTFLGCDGTFYREGRSSRYKVRATSACHDSPTPPGQPPGMCYYTLSTGEAGCCTWIEGDCPRDIEDIIVTTITP